MSLGIIVVEAAKNSGSLITARFASEQGRDVFAVPGSPLDPRAEGTNHLLRDGVQICTCVEDVIESLARLQKGLRPGDLFSEPDHVENPDEPLWDELDLGDAADVPPNRINALDADRTAHAPETRRKPDAPTAHGASAEEAFVGPEKVIGLLGPSPISIDELVRAADMPAQAIRAILLKLELEGRLERHGGNLVSLI
jgi:DNA processing protein